MLTLAPQRPAVVAQDWGPGGSGERARPRSGFARITQDNEVTDRSK